ncbi:MAG: PhnD/SsuA/transferrin family substrate-binding protein [Pseudomonadota bacterium]
MLRFATGPFRKTAAETRAEWQPLVRYIGQQLELDTQLTVCDSWDGLADAITQGDCDAAWMGGGFRYVQARARGAGPAIATVASAGSPWCHAIVVGARHIASHAFRFPRDARGLSLAFTHDQSTTGWLMVYAALAAQGIKPESYFRYSACNQHADNELDVASGRCDLATDSESNRSAMVQRGLVKEADVPVVWRSEPLPQDPIAVSARMPAALAARLQRVLADIGTSDQHSCQMPAGYSGFAVACDDSYSAIRAAARLVGRLPLASVPGQGEEVPPLSSHV